MKYIKTLIILLLIPLLIVVISKMQKSKNLYANNVSKIFTVQSIDTMKYSRDKARITLKDPSFNQEIKTQIKLIAETGANYVAIDTPYDLEFIPVLKRWVDAAHEQGLSVWFRGNLSGWESWFGYNRIDSKEHARLLDIIFKTKYKFISKWRYFYALS